MQVVDERLQAARLTVLGERRGRHLAGMLRSRVARVLLHDLELVLELLVHLWLRGHAHRPFHCGSRFSKNAVTPSTMSSVDIARLSWERRYSSASMNGMSS